MGDGLLGVIDTSFRLDRSAAFDPMAPVRMLQAAIGQGLLVLAPFALLMLLVAVATPALLGGWSFNLESLLPKPEKMNPLKGLQRMFSVKALVELIKALAKVAMVALVGVFILYSFKGDFIALTGVSLDTGIALGISLFFKAFVMLSSALLVVVAIDVPFQLWENTKKLRMRKQRAKDAP